MQLSVGQTGKFGQLNYTVPDGWKETRYQNGVRLEISPQPGEMLIIDILPALLFNGSIQQVLEKSYDETCAILQVSKMRESDGTSYSVKEVKISFRGWEYIRCSGGIKVNNGTPYPDEYGLDLFVIKVNNRFERVSVVKSRNTCGGLYRYYPSDRLNYRNTIEEFFFSLRFDDWQEPYVKNGTVTGDGIIGVWQGIGLSVGISGASLKVQQLILFSNGQGYYGRNFPLEGLDKFNTRIAAENNRRDWGTYTFQNGKGILKMTYGDIPLRMEGNKLIITTNKTDHGFIKSNPVDDARFNGTYSMSEAYGMIPSVTLTADGKFMDRGVIRVLCHEIIDCINPAVKPGSGTYEVKNHSVIFTYTDGRKIKIAFPGTGFEKNNSSPSALVLSFNQDMLKRAN